MSLKSYKKGAIKYKKREDRETITIKPTLPQRKVTLWDLSRTAYGEVVEILSFSKIAALTVPIILVFFGLVILYNQIWPEVEQKILENEGYFEQGTTALVAGDYIEERQLYLSNPGSDYFKTLADNAFEKRVLQDDPISRNFQDTFYISIESLNLYNLPITPNVDSGNEELYNKVLQNSLAHMQGTGLPVSNIDNNMVIYGHSANGSYYERTQDPAGAFSRLQKVKIGDEVLITIGGEEYKYKIFKTKIVNPDDISIVNGTPNKQTLTLFTCFPNGNPAKRFIAVARPIE